MRTMMMRRREAGRDEEEGVESSSSFLSLPLTSLAKVLGRDSSMMKFIRN